MKLTQQEYWSEVAEIASLLADEDALAAEYGDDAEPSDVLHEIIDGHQYIIYTYLALKVMEYTDNADAYWEEMGEAPPSDSWSSLIPPLAYFAMQQDIYDYEVRLESGQQNPKRARGRGRGRGGRRNFSEQQHRDLYENWSVAERSSLWASKQAKRADRPHYARIYGMRASEAGGHREANALAMRGDYDRAQKDARSLTAVADTAAIDFYDQATGNPPRGDGKWHRGKMGDGLDALTLRAVTTGRRGSSAAMAMAMAYHPRKRPLSAEWAAAYEAQKGQKLPKGTKWILAVTSPPYATASWSAHRTMQSAKKAGAKAIGASNPKRKTKKRKK